MMKERLFQRVDELIDTAGAVLATRWCYDILQYVDTGAMRGFRTASLSFIQRVYDDKHPHYVEFSETVKNAYPPDIENGLGILKAIRDEIAGDWLFEVRSLVAAEVFTDYLEMAEYVLKEGYKDPAAVIAGSTLEEHLRQLCRESGILVTWQKDCEDVPLKADALNGELAKAEVYTKLDQKAVTTWLDLRNNVAHGKYGAYNAEQIKAMLAGVTEFTRRVAV